MERQPDPTREAGQRPPYGVDRWTFTERSGSRIAIVEKTTRQETISLTTPGEIPATLTHASGGEIEFKTPIMTVTFDTSGITVNTQGTVEVTAGQVKIDAAMVDCSGGMKCKGLGSAPPPSLKLLQVLSTADHVDTEALADAEKRIPNLLRNRDRAVTSANFKPITARVPGQPIGLVAVLP